MPTDVMRVDIAESVSPIEAREEFDRILLFVTAKDRPLGYVTLTNDHSPFSSDEIRYRIATELPESSLELVDDLLAKGSAEEPVSSSRPTVSIALCTLDRPDELRTCLDSLMRLEYPNVQIIVVDNNPASGKTSTVAAEYPVCYVAETRRGLSYARNAGIRAAEGEIVVCTDDDVIVQPDWLDRLIAPFSDPDVMCVTGLTVPLELKTKAQEMYEEYGGLGRGFERRVYDSDYFRARKIRAVQTWHIGATANAAFRKSGLQEVGLFDVTLGPGVPSGVGEDTYVFYNLLRLGYKIVYEPSAYVYHRHRSSYEQLRRQIFDYSRGHYAYHTRCLLDHRDHRGVFHMLVTIPWSYVRRIRRTLRGRSSYPLRLLVWEIWGNTLGPLSLVRSIVRARRIARSGT